jgi:hypothetical protein
MVSEFAPFVAIEMEKQKPSGIISPYFFVHKNG